MRTALYVSAFTSMMLSAAIFGFFYAWVCSTMWGLDQLEPDTAIAAMQAMNVSVRNAVFAPAFFGTPAALLITAALARISGARAVAICFALAAVVYLAGAFAVTAQVNVPMNLALARLQFPQDAADAARTWQDYSARWQAFNQLRTVMCGITLLLVASGLHLLGRKA